MLMGVMDRVREKQRQKALQAADSSLDSAGTSNLVLAEPPHIARLKGVLRVLRQFIEQNQDGSGMARMGFVLTTIGDELADELTDMDEIQIRVFLSQIGEVIAWVGHGDNTRLPDSVKVFAETVQPSVPSPRYHCDFDKCPGCEAGAACDGAVDTNGNPPIEIGAATR